MQFNGLIYSLGQPQIITGTKLYLDAANKSSYPGTGTTWTDLSGNSNNGTLTNGPTFDSANEGSILFDGVNDVVTCGNAASLSFSTNITVLVWLKTSHTSTFRGIVDKGRDNYGAWSLVIGETANKATFKCRIASTNRSVTAANNYSNNIWNQIAATFNGSTLSIYLNDKLDNSASFSGSIGTNSESVRVGSSSDGFAASVDGNISFVQIFDRALSAVEILQNYNALRTRYNLP